MPTCSGYPLKGTILVQAISLADKLSMFSEHWQPRVVGQFNGHDLMVVKVKGEFVWHKHDDSDDFFLVLSRAKCLWSLRVWSIAQSQKTKPTSS